MAGSRDQRRDAVFVRLVQLGPGLDEIGDAVCVTLLGSRVQRRETGRTYHIHIGAGLGEVGDNASKAVQGGL